MAFVDIIERWIERYAKALLAALLIYAAAHFLQAAKRPFNFDEFFTFYIASLGNFWSVLRAAPADGQPPLYYELAHFSQSLGGSPELTTRLPSIVAFLGMLVCVYVFVRRRGTALSALFAAVVVLASPVAFFATQARPYALMLFFTALALAAWQRAAERSSNRTLPLSIMVVGIAGAIASHHFGVLSVGLPLAVGELWRLARTRRLDVPLLLAGVTGAATLLATLPLMLQTNGALLDHVRDSDIFFGRPKLAQLGVYEQMANLPVIAGFLLLSLLIALIAPPPGTPVARAPIPGHEIAAAITLVLLVPVMLAVAWIATGFFQSRYAVGTSIGIAILLGFAVSAPAPLFRGTTLAALIAVPVLLWGNDIRAGIAEMRGRHVAAGTETFPAILLATPGDMPIVVADPWDYAALYFYAPDSVKRKLTLLTDLQQAIRKADPLAELSMIGNRAFVPFHLSDYGDFVRGNGAFYLYCHPGLPSPCQSDRAWVKDRFLSDGFGVIAMPGEASGSLFRVERPTLR